MTDLGPTGPGMSGSGALFAPPPTMGAYAVKLQAFEGPLDLLLHLIRQAELDVTDIPIADVARQYVDYLSMMDELNLDVAGEYLVMAATLAWIKSRMILPPPDDGSDEEGLDPRAELVARLLDYQRFKEVADELGERARLERDVFAAAGAEPEATPDHEREIKVGMVQLLEAYRRVLKGVRPVGTGLHEIEAEVVTVHERMTAVMEVMAKNETIEFSRVFEIEDGTPSRALIVTTFLAILELTRLAAIRIYQSVDESLVPEGPIRLRRHEAPGSDWAESIAEIM